MIRAAAKNHDFVTVVVDPADYADLKKELTTHDGATCLRFPPAPGAQGLRAHGGL